MSCRCEAGFEQAQEGDTFELVGVETVVESQFSDDVVRATWRCRACGTVWEVEDGTIVGRTPPARPERVRVSKKKPDQRVEGREWTWNEDDFGCDGVHTFENKLVWFHFSGNPHGSQAGRDQSFTSYLKRGPAVDEVPDEVQQELTAFLERFYRVEQG